MEADVLRFHYGIVSVAECRLLIRKNPRTFFVHAASEQNTHYPV